MAEIRGKGEVRIWYNNVEIEIDDVRFDLSGLEPETRTISLYLWLAPEQIEQSVLASLFSFGDNEGWP